MCFQQMLGNLVTQTGGDVLPIVVTVMQSQFPVAVVGISDEPDTRNQTKAIVSIVVLAHQSIPQVILPGSFAYASMNFRKVAAIIRGGASVHRTWNTGAACVESAVNLTA